MPDETGSQIRKLLLLMKRGILCQLAAVDGVVVVSNTKEWHEAAAEAVKALEDCYALVGKAHDLDDASELLMLRDTIRIKVRKTEKLGKEYSKTVEAVTTNLGADLGIEQEDTKFTWNRHVPLGEFKLMTMQEYSEWIESPQVANIDGEYVYDLLRDIQEITDEIKTYGGEE